ncbi:MAG: helix-turn-helix domain-containing protein [Cyclobacteriaceae bacterium]|jgi:transcriptional regulator with XRE-family HTH domain
MVADRLFELRKRQNWSLMDLSKNSGIAKAILHRYEKGVKPSRKNLEKIAAAFKVSVDVFLTDEAELKEMPKPSLKAALEENLKELKYYSTSEISALNEFLNQINSKRNLLKQIARISKESIDV